MTHTVEVESVVGAGTTFRITVPACQAPPTPPRPRDTDTVDEVCAAVLATLPR